MKFTFKTIKPTGRYKSFHSSAHYIKLKGHEVGTIEDEYPFTIRLMVTKKDINEDGNPNCTWRWIKLSHKSISLQLAKDWLNSYCKVITTDYNLYLYPKD